MKKTQQNVLLALAAVVALFYLIRWRKSSGNNLVTQNQQSQGGGGLEQEEEEIIEEQTEEEEVIVTETEEEEDTTQGPAAIVPNIQLVVTGDINTVAGSSMNVITASLVIPVGYTVTKIYSSASVNAAVNFGNYCFDGTYPMTFNVPGSLIRASVTGFATKIIPEGMYPVANSALQYLFVTALPGAVLVNDCTGDQFNFLPPLPAGDQPLFTIAQSGSSYASGQFAIMVNDGSDFFPMHFQFDGPGTYTSSTYINCTEL